MLTGTSFVSLSFFLAHRTVGVTVSGEESSQGTGDYSSNNFRQLGVRRCKNARLSLE